MTEEANSTHPPVGLVTADVTEDSFSLPKLVAVAVAGAATSLGLYYFYHNLDNDKKKQIRKKATGMIAEQIHTLTDIREL